MKKIVIDARGFSGSNGEYIQNLLLHLDNVDNNLSHRYVALMKPKDIETWNPKSKRFSKVSCRYGAFTVVEQFGLAWQLYRLNADLVHFTSPNQPVLYWRRKITTIHDLNNLRFRSQAKHKIASWTKHQRRLWIKRFAIKTSKVIITPSIFMKEDVAKFARANSRKFVVTPEAADPIKATATRPETVQESQKFLLFLGRPAIQKNLGTLIEAFELLQDKNPDLVLVLAGKKDGLYKSFERLVGKHDLSEKIIFTNYVSDGELRWLYENCAAFVMPSFNEGFGIVGIEAMQHGAPVISSNASSFPEIYGDAAEYFNPHSPEDIASKIRKVLNNSELRNELSKTGKRQAAKYSWDRMAQQTLDVYKNILKES